MMQRPLFISIASLTGFMLTLGCSVEDPVPIGGACAADLPCSTGFCIREKREAESLAWAEGYCSAVCSGTSSCPAGATCVTFADGSAYCAASCSTGSACRTGYVCSLAAGACLPDCRLGWSCGDSLQCDPTSGACVVSTTAPGPVGAPCEFNAECQSGLCTPERASTSSGTEWMDGYCTQACNRAVCPPQATCITYADGSAYCAASCSTGSACRTGYVCSLAAGACLPDCRLGWSCGDSLECDASTGACVVPGTAVPATAVVPIGAACQLNVECQSGLCIPESTSTNGTQWTDGYCSETCSAATPCPAGSTCVTFADGTAYCASSCTAGSGVCRTGYVCSTAVSACLPDCRLGWSCGSTLLCDAATGTCVYPSDAGAEAGLDAGGIDPDAGVSSDGAVDSATVMEAGNPEAGMRQDSGSGLGPGGPGGG